MKDIIERLNQTGVMSYMPAVTIDVIRYYEPKLPTAYCEWLEYSDGGELYDGALQLYGIVANPLISVANEAIVSLVSDRLVSIGSFDFGDPVCFIKGEERIVQVDHETGHVSYRWEDFKAFLLELIEDFGGETS